MDDRRAGGAANGMTDNTVRPKRALRERALWRPPWGESDFRDSNLQWLDKNENPDTTLAERIAGILAEMPCSIHSSYPELGPLYRKLAAFFGIDIRNLVLSNGSDGLIRLAFDAFVDYGDTVLHTDPTFAMYSVYCDMFGARGIEIHYEQRSGSIRIDLDRLIETILAENPRLVCIPNPDSPTGSAVSLSDLRKVIDAAREVGAVALVDEAYFPFNRDTVVPDVVACENLFVTRSTGKAWGMAGMRIGIGVGSEDVVAHVHRVRPMYECNAVGAYVLEKMLDHYDEVEQSVDRLVAGRDWFALEMGKLGYTVIPTSGNFVHVAFGSDEPRVAEALEGTVYYRRETNHPALSGYSRFSATTVENFEIIVERIRTRTNG